MKAEFGNDSFDAPVADGEPGLSKLLRDHLDGSVRVQEAMSNDLANQFARASIVPLGATALAVQGDSAVRSVRLAQLKVPLFGEAEFPGGFGGSGPLTFSLDEHDQFPSDLVVVEHGQGSVGPDHGVCFCVELHLRTSLSAVIERETVTVRQGREWRAGSQIKYVGFLGAKGHIISIYKAYS